MIQINDDLAITADGYQYILGKPVARPRKGAQNVEIKNPRYFPTMGKAINGALSQAMRSKVADGSIQTLKTWLDEYAALQERFRELLAPFEEGKEE